MKYEELTQSIRSFNWRNILFIVGAGLVAVFGAPWYLWKYGISFSEIALFVFYIAASGLGVTVGYHRLFAHANYKANPVLTFLLLFFGVAAYEESALQWASQHRDHHRYVDTDKDPYSIKKGFWYAHIGWLFFWSHPKDFSNVKDLQRSRLIVHQDKYYYVWSFVAGILTPLLIGALTGHLLGAFIFSVCVRLTLVYQATFSINSICHYFGKKTYDKNSTARDHWFAALVSYGEGYHNFHHRFPTDYRNGVRWYHWDPSKWTIRLLSRLGMARDLRKVSDSIISAARIEAEKKVPLVPAAKLAELVIPLKKPATAG